MAEGGFIWLVDGRRWPYPALCHGKTMERITRIMLDRLEREGLIRERKRDGAFATNSWDITEEGRSGVEASHVLRGR